MFALTISLRALDEAAAATVRAASRDVVAPSLAETGCLFFDVLFDDADPLLVRFYEAYVDRAAFEAHLAADHTRQWVERCMPLIDRPSIRMPESVSSWRSEG
jgi:(4S)-4-hydroxy-5-phosphonooxypentane-2,3-dione isomerase